ncbi:LytTR family DNA-binding domain-containing protein [Paenibacillus sp. J22TS3]|uniref:LytTR family DNA-binding domain-containing protein n=1 Tax=Paenibacillus sp. J22TS3 TaxID=2807192 RepID=UPI001B0DC50C|nr:LytTR family DNA-binding domain-containing protein [Paenibacillus sp. J22TS3]GIP22136.1 LytR family transcriptional regulator [Paenibacillus sp. J22TS3]
MKVSIVEISRDEDEEILIRCYEVNEEVQEIVNKLKMDNPIMLGYLGEHVHRIKLSEIYYFEAVDGKVFIYCKDRVFEVKQRLYELEELSHRMNFFRASKSTILNIAKISYVHPSLSGRFEAVLDNGERVVISRQYVPVLKNKLGL